VKISKRHIRTLIKESVDKYLNETMIAPADELSMMAKKVGETENLTPRQKENLIKLLQGTPEEINQGKEIFMALPDLTQSYDDYDRRLMSKEYEEEFKFASNPLNILNAQLVTLIGHVMNNGPHPDSVKGGHKEPGVSPDNYFQVISNQYTYTFHPERIMNALIKVPAYEVRLRGDEANVKEAFRILMNTGEYKSEMDPGTHYVGDDETYVAELQKIPTETEQEASATAYLKRTFNRPDHYHTGFEGTTGERLASDREKDLLKRIMSRLN